MDLIGNILVILSVGLHQQHIYCQTPQIRNQIFRILKHCLKS